MKRKSPGRDTKIELQLTSMIDVIFLLLAFFVMTFKIVVPEGDFNIKMPQSAPSDGAPDPDAIPPVKVELKSNENGDITNIYFQGQPLGSDFGKLRAKAMQLVNPDAGPSSSSDQLEVEIEAQYELDYKYAIDAMTAVTGYRDDDGQIITLIEQVRFVPPTQ